MSEKVKIERISSFFIEYIKLLIMNSEITDIEFEDVIKGLLKLGETPLNPNAEEWKPKTRSHNHLRGKVRQKKRRQLYVPGLCRYDLFQQSINDFMMSKEFKNHLQEPARTMAFKTVTPPKWEVMETMLLKAIFVLLSQVNNIDYFMDRPLSKYSRQNFIEFIEKYWKPAVNETDAEMCVVCHETMTKEIPTIQLLCKHTLCTHCFLKCCKHEDDVIRRCPICRAGVRL